MVNDNRKQPVDPRVMDDDLRLYELAYDLEYDGSAVEFNDPSPIQFETDLFDARLAGETLTCQLRTPFGSVEEARRAVDSWIRAWEIDTALKDHSGRLAFRFRSGRVVGEDPGSVTLHVAGADLLMQGGIAIAKITRKEYPPPPEAFTANEHVEALWHLFDGFLNKRIPLTMVAYSCLSYIEQMFGGGNGRQDAARQLNISRNILTEMARLCSDNRCHHGVARKFTGTRAPVELDTQEVDWVIAALTMLIRRAGDPKPDSRPQLTMSDLPDYPE